MTGRGETQAEPDFVAAGLLELVPASADLPAPDEAGLAALVPELLSELWDA